MLGKSRAFLNDESGAVTVDWVVLTAAIVGLAAFAVISVRDASVTLGNRISDEVATFEWN